MNAFRWLAALAVLSCSASATARPWDAHAAGGTYELVANAPVEAQLRTARETLEVRGRLSLFVHYTGALTDAGKVEARAMNVVFFEVPQDRITGVPPVRIRNAGILSFALRDRVRPQLLKYDKNTHTISGKLPIEAHFAQLDELLPPEEGKTAEHDWVASPTIPGDIDVHVSIGASPEELSQRPGRGDFKANARFVRRVKGRLRVEPFNVSIPDPQLDLTAGSANDTSVGRSLCIQPVFVKASATDPPTGAAFAAGMPGVDSEWGHKAGVVFKVQDPIELIEPSLKEVHVGEEETTLLSKVNMPDCIEVYFVEAFDPPNLHGGANTWAPGHPDAKVIVSDAFAGTSDTMYLAHELGHVMGIGHPDLPFRLARGSTNTLMCTSNLGQARPARNSQFNADHVLNTLETFELTPKLTPPDCQGSADCGRCP